MERCNLFSLNLDRASKIITNAEPLLDNSDEYYGSDIAIDAVNNKIYWQASAAADRISSANMDGTGQDLDFLNNLTYSTGIALGGGKLFYWNWESGYATADIYKSNLDGTGIVKITGGAGQFNGYAADTKDLEFYNNKIYFQYSDGTNYNIASANTDGSGFSNLYSTSNFFGGLTVSNDTLYWTEGNILNKRAISGGAVTQLALQSGRAFGDLIVDHQTSQVYFIESDPIIGGYSVIKRVSVNGGSTATVLTISGTVSSIGFDNSFSVLPVSLLNFSGQYDAVHNSSMLKWTTSSEVRSAHFILERSIDGSNFKSVATVAATGASSIINNYQYNDDVSSITADKFYYRLKQVDLDGQFKYSQIVVLNRKDISIAKVWPNPGKGNFVVDLGTLPSAPVTINVYSGNGSLVASSKFGTQQYNLDLEKQAAGVYNVELIYSSGAKKQLTLIKE